MKKVLVLFLFCIFFSSFGFALLDRHYIISGLTIPQADSLYCKQNGACNITLLHFINSTSISINTTTINATSINLRGYPVNNTEETKNYLSSNYVPYQNANQAVDLNTQTLTFTSGGIATMPLSIGFNDGFGSSYTTYGGFDVEVDTLTGASSYDIWSDIPYCWNTRPAGAGTPLMCIETGKVDIYQPLQATSITAQEYLKGSDWVNDTLEVMTLVNYTIDTIITGNTYIPQTNVSTAGTIANGSISLMQTYDGLTFNISEIVTGDNLVHYINFTNVADVNRIKIRYKFASANDYITIYLKSLTGWESYGSIYPSSEFEVESFDVDDPLNHIINNIVEMKLSHSGTASTQHKLSIDYIWLLDGYTPISASEVDPHFVSWYNDSNPMITGNLTVGKTRFYANTTFEGFTVFRYPNQSGEYMKFFVFDTNGNGAISGTTNTMNLNFPGYNFQTTGTVRMGVESARIFSNVPFSAWNINTSNITARGDVNITENLTVGGAIIDLGVTRLAGETGSLPELRIRRVSDDSYNTYIRVGGFLSSLAQVGLYTSSVDSTWTTYTNSRTFIDNAQNYTILHNNLTSDVEANKIIIQGQYGFGKSGFTSNGGEIILQGGIPNATGKFGNITMQPRGGEVVIKGNLSVQIISLGWTGVSESIICKNSSGHILIGNTSRSKCYE